MQWCTYYREITEDENVSFHRVQISYEEDSNSLNPPEVRLDFEYIADVKREAYLVFIWIINV